MSGVRSAEENRQDYARRKTEIIDLLDKAAEFYKTEDKTTNVEAFQKLRDDLENGEFSIVVVGEFSAGKSTLLNALMRKRILPSFTNETTATVNFLRHSEKSENGEAGKVYYYDGTQLPLENADLETIGQYVSTKGDEVAHTIEHLDLYLDSDFLKDGVTLVDSPGLNGVADRHREITEAQILKSHASIFVFNSDHPGSKTDFEFLYDLQKKVKTIIFVLNKIDSIKAEEDETVEKVVDSLKANYQKQFPEVKEVPEIWPVAAYPALVARNQDPMEHHAKSDWSIEEREKLEADSRISAFEDRLIQFLTCGEKTYQQLKAPIDRVVAVTDESRRQYEEEIKMLQSKQDASELENRIAEIKDAMSELEKQVEEKRTAISNQTDTVLRDVREAISANLQKLQERKLREIDEFDDMEELLDYLESFEERFLKQAVRYARDENENLWERILSIVKIQYGRVASDIENNMAEENDIVNLELSDHLTSEDQTYELGLNEMDEKINQCKEEHKRLKEEENALGKNYINSRAIEKEKKRLEAREQELRESKESIKNQILPPVETYTEEKMVKENRRGLFGMIAQVFVGKNRLCARREGATAQHMMQHWRLNRQHFEKQIRKLKKSLKNVIVMGILMRKQRNFVGLGRKRKRQRQGNP